MKKIGVTGGIGSGKSLICTIFEAMGYEVYYADIRAKQLMLEDANIIKRVKKLFGESAYLPDRSLNRSYIGDIVFNDKQKLQALNAIVHPATGKDFERWLRAKRATYSKAFLLKEAAILYESGAYKGVDAVITVYAPKHIRLQRVMKRDGVKAKSVLQRMDKQWSALRKLRQADFVIYNDGKHALCTQVIAAIQHFSK